MINKATELNNAERPLNGHFRPSTLHRIEMDMVDLMMDVMRFSIARISSHEPALGAPKKETELKELVGETVTSQGLGGDKALALFKDYLLPANVATDHPRFLSFIPSAPSRASVLFDLMTSAVSIHGANWMTGAGGIFCENEAMRWIVSLTGMPEGSFGVFTSGGTVANLSALVTAREGWRERNPELQHIKPIVLIANSAHSSNKQMARVMDVDVVSGALDEHDRLTVGTVQEAYNALSDEDKARVFCVIATAGTTNAGVIDDLNGIGTWCHQNNVWFHIDAAYGGGALASPNIRPEFSGVELADSLTVDPHKWMFTPYDCGAVIYRDMTLAKRSHTQTAPYLDIFEVEEAQGFNPSDYQIQLSRRLRGLPLWFSLTMNGTQIYADGIDYAIELAKYAEKQIHASDYLEMVRPRGLSIVIIRRKGWTEEDYFKWSIQLQKEGTAVVMPTKWKGETVTRLCFINGNTTQDDVDLIFDSMA